MKRLIKTSRLRRKIYAEWTPIDPQAGDAVQVVTDAMAAGTQIQIEYQGSGWRLIQPYGWNTSKAGNILLMCYKDTGEVRSYRLDRINQILVDDTLLANQPVDSVDGNGMYEVRDYKVKPEDYEIPPLPNMDEILEQSENEQGQELPFDEGLKYLTDGPDATPEIDETNVEDPEQQIETQEEPVDNEEEVEEKKPA
jgi:hypothetical protein